jgi:hypothetical protein
MKFVPFPRRLASDTLTHIYDQGLSLIYRSSSYRSSNCICHFNIPQRFSPNSGTDAFPGVSDGCATTLACG